MTNLHKIKITKFLSAKNNFLFKCVNSEKLNKRVIKVDFKAILILISLSTSIELIKPNKIKLEAYKAHYLHSNPC